MKITRNRILTALSNFDINMKRTHIPDMSIDVSTGLERKSIGLMKNLDSNHFPGPATK